MPTSPQKSTVPAQAYLLLGILALVWGSSFILMKRALVGFSAPQVASLRIFAAFVFFLPVAFAHRGDLPPRSRWGLVALAGALGNLIPAFLFTWAGKDLDSSVIGILNSFTPLFGLLIGAAFFGQALRAQQLIGMLFGLVGCGLIIFVGTGGTLRLNAYALLPILATVCYGLNLHVIKRASAGLKSVPFTAATFLAIGPLATIALFSTDFSQRAAQSGTVWPLLAGLTLGILGSGVAMIFFNRLIQIVSTVFASSVTYLIPIVSVGWGLLDGERLSAQQFLGMAVILVGVYLVNRPARVPRSTARSTSVEA
jgi:drug/metabolite transporter (DMT)-like permease